MKNINVENILKVTKVELISGNKNLECKNFSKDTRIIQSGDTYIGIKGANFDGSKFWKEALKARSWVCNSWKRRIHKRRYRRVQRKNNHKSKKHIRSVIWNC